MRKRNLNVSFRVTDEEKKLIEDFINDNSNYKTLRDFVLSSVTQNIQLSKGVK